MKLELLRPRRCFIQFRSQEEQRARCALARARCGLRAAPLHARPYDQFPLQEDALAVRTRRQPTLIITISYVD